MKKRLACLVLALVMMVSTLCVATTSSAISDADFVAPEILVPENLIVPDNDLLTNSESFTLSEGSRYEIDVKTNFIEEGRFNRPGTINYQKYIVIHNTGSYPISSTALGNHNYCLTTTADVSWHYTCGNDGIYQQIPANEKGWHAGGNYWNDATLKDKVTDGSNSTSVGIETCVNGFPADSTASGEHWNSDEMYEWYETHYDYTATYLAQLVAFLCVKLNFNPYTQIITHYQTAAKNCPMQMRYIFGTNAQFTINGTYFKVFLDRMYDYYESFGGSYTSADTLKNVYYNPNYKTYDAGLYKAPGTASNVLLGDVTGDSKVSSLDAAFILRYDADLVEELDTAAADVDGNGKVNSLDAAFVLRYDADLVDKFPAENATSRAVSGVTVYRAGNTSTEVVGALKAGEVVDVTVTGWNWGKVTLADGTTGWVDLDELEFVTDKYDYGTYRTAEGEIVNVTAIDGTTATYEGGTADINTLTRVYKVEVKGDTEFGAEAKYLASGETFSVTSVAPVAPMLFDIWEVTSGVAAIEDKEAQQTTVTVLNSDIVLTSSQRDKYDLLVEYGTGAGRYNVGDEVTVTARARVGYTFQNWEVVSGAGEFVDATAFTATFIMGNADTKIQAVYKISQNIDLEGLQNYALDGSYTFSWKELTGEDIAWRGNLKDLDCTKLNDGVIATSSFSESKTDLYLGVQGTAGMAEIVFTLDGTKEISKVVLRDIADNGGSFGDIDSTSIAISVSNDGVEYTAVEGLSDTLYFSYKIGEDGTVTQITDHYTHSVDFAVSSANYVKIRFKSGKYLTTLSEVEIYGAEGQAD
ncbi:MAG: N-acetylmuramoyl-L-alanine amidase [Clostridia bacterium]|nr:N-acetylmuramoyl-L-alanine amidase [Clostridia bacterium]